MIRTLRRPMMAIALLLLISSCQPTTQEKVRAFVESYNDGTKWFNDPIIAKTFAEEVDNEKVKGRKDIKIVFQTKLSKNEGDEAIFESLLPTLYGNMIKSEKYANDLIERGVTFQFELRDKSNRSIGSVEIDKAKLQQIATQKTETKNPDFSDNGLSSQTNETLAALNKSLPIVIDKQLNIKMVKIEVNKAKELVYVAEVPNKMAQLFKNKNIGDLMKQEILRSSDIPTLLSKIKSMGLKNLRYSYKDEKGNELISIPITDTDL